MIWGLILGCLFIRPKEFRFSRRERVGYEHLRTLRFPFLWTCCIFSSGLFLNTVSCIFSVLCVQTILWLEHVSSLSDSNRIGYRNYGSSRKKNTRGKWAHWEHFRCRARTRADPDEDFDRRLVFRFWIQMLRAPFVYPNCTLCLCIRSVTCCFTSSSNRPCRIFPGELGLWRCKKKTSMLLVKKSFWARVEIMICPAPFQWETWTFLKDGGDMPRSVHRGGTCFTRIT